MSTCENLTLLCLELKLESIGRTDDSVYSSGHVLLFDIVMYITMCIVRFLK